MGVHTGDSHHRRADPDADRQGIPADARCRIAVIRAVGVETGGSNIQFAHQPRQRRHGRRRDEPARVAVVGAGVARRRVIPIAKIAAKLAVGYTLDELPNYITSNKDPKTASCTRRACFEPTIDYCVIKIPRWTFEKFPDADETLTTQMKSVGEAMAIGRTFKEALQKGIRSMEVKRFGFGLDKYDKWLNAQRNSGTGVQPVSATKHKHGRDARATMTTPTRPPRANRLDHEWPIPDDKLRRKLAVPSQGRLYYIRYALKMGWTIEQIHELTNIDPWFLAQMKELVDFEGTLDEAADALVVSTRRKPDVFANVDRRAPSSWATATSSSRTRLGIDAADVRAAPRVRWRRARLQARRHLRRRVRSGDAVLLLDVRDALHRQTASPSSKTKSASPTSPRSSSSAAARTASGRGSSSTTAACRPRSRCRSWASSR